jgi:DNA uptake protein ComE-like DNA-binding protein
VTTTTAETSATAPAGQAETTSAAASTDAAATVATKLNLNEVTEEELLSKIPDFSNRMVREFFEYRPYVSIQQFRKEIGKYVSAEQVSAYEQYVYVPVDVDEADAATLQQLPGVDATMRELVQ